MSNVQPSARQSFKEDRSAVRAGRRSYRPGSSMVRLSEFAFPYTISEGCPFF